MSENGPTRNPGPPHEDVDSQHSERSFDLSEFTRSSEESSRQRKTSQQDEILRTDDSREGFNQVGESKPQDAVSTPDPGGSRVQSASTATGDAHWGWLPTSQFLTLKEFSVTLIVAEVLWIIAVVVLEKAEKLVGLPDLISGNELITGLLLGLFGGLYVSLRLRGRRLAWKAHLRGER